MPTNELDVTAGIELKRTMKQAKVKARQRLSDVDGPLGFNSWWS